MSQRKPTDLELTNYATAVITNGGDMSKAFQAAFPKSKMKGSALNVSASKFDKLPKVRLRVSKLHKEINEKADKGAIFTASEAMVEYEEARQVAKETKNSAGMSKATDGKVKVAGLEKTNVNITGNLGIKRTLADFYAEQD